VYLTYASVHLFKKILTTTNKFGERRGQKAHQHSHKFLGIDKSTPGVKTSVPMSVQSLALDMSVALQPTVKIILYKQDHFKAGETSVTSVMSV
jgi:hypothetical protein